MRISITALAALSLSAASPADDVKHNYDLQNVLWRLQFSMDGGTISGDVVNTLVLGEDSLTVQLSCAELSVSKVTVNGSDAKFANADGVLTITLPQPGKKGQSLDVETTYTGAPVNGLYFVPASRAFPAHTGMLYTQGEGEDNHFWLPTYDKPDDKATTECYITVPPKWTAISNGRLVDVQNGKDGRIFHWKMDQPYSTYLISIVAGEYSQGKGQWRGIPVDYYVPPGLEVEGNTSFEITPKMIDLYSKITGFDYPYPKFAQETVSDYMFGGMENITAVTQTIRTLHLPSTEPVNDSQGLVAHELAHQWFGDTVTCRTWEHTWVNEGFATFLPTFWDRDGKRDRDQFDLDRFDNFEGAIDTIGSRSRKEVPGAVGSVPTVNIGSPYAGGCSRMMALMHDLGEPVFWKGIHDFLVNYKFQPVTTDDFFASMGKTAGKDLKPFESQWFHSAAMPSLTVSLAGTNLVVSQLAPFYTLDLPVYVLETPVQTTLFSSPVWEKKTVHVTGAQATLALTPDEAKLPILVDPEVWFPAEISYKIPYNPDQVALLYNRAPNLAEKARILIELFDALPIANRLKIAQSEHSPKMQARLAKHFGQDGIAYLLELTRSSDERVVNAALLQIATLKTDPTLVTRMTEIVDKNPNETLRERATQALLNWSTDIKLAQKAYQTKAFDDGFRVMALHWMGDHAVDIARTTCLQILQNPDSEPLRIAACQVLGVVKDKPGGHAVYDALISVAKETSFNARRAAINSLALLGNKAAIPVLQPFTEHGPGGIRGAATAAVGALSK